MLMQWPPTKPGVSFMKFHFVEAASITSNEEIPNEVNNWCISFINAILTSLWIFSETFAASATLIDDAWWIPASIIEEYKKDITLRASLFDADTTFVIVSMVLILSPGTILSGLYPVEKSSLKINLDFSSKIGVHMSSVTPG